RLAEPEEDKPAAQDEPRIPARGQTGYQMWVSRVPRIGLLSAIKDNAAGECLGDLFLGAIIVLVNCRRPAALLVDDLLVRLGDLLGTGGGLQPLWKPQGDLRKVDQ